MRQMKQKSLLVGVGEVLTLSKRVSISKILLGKKYNALFFQNNLTRKSMQKLCTISFIILSRTSFELTIRPFVASWTALLLSIANRIHLRWQSPIATRVDASVISYFVRYFLTSRHTHPHQISLRILQLKERKFSQEMLNCVFFFFALFTGDLMYQV